MTPFEAWAWGFGWGIFATIATWFVFSIEASIVRGEARAADDRRAKLGSVNPRTSPGAAGGSKPVKP